MTTHETAKASRPLVLIADDDEHLVDALRRRCELLGLQVVAAHDCASALAALDRHEPSLMILDVGMPGGSGLEVCRTLAASDYTRHMPVIIVTGREDENTIRRCHDFMAYYVPKCADVWSRIAPLLAELLGMGHPEPEPPSRPPPSGLEPNAPERPACRRGWVLCIDDDSAFARSLQLRLESMGVSVRSTHSGMEGYCSAFLHHPHAIVLDFEMADGNGDYVLGRLKENPHTRPIPVVVLTGLKGKALERRMANLGAARFFNKPIAWEDLWAELEQHLPAAASGEMASGDRRAPDCGMPASCQAAGPHAK